MTNKNELLSIGEMAKLTGAGIRALHYYERKNILKPVFVNPDSGYRYYALNQVIFVTLITNCVEFGIPLKGLADVIASDDMDALRNFLEKSLEVFERKTMLLKLATNAFESALQQIELGKEYAVGQIYRRSFEEKVYYVKSYGQTITDKNAFNMYYEVAHEVAREIYGDTVNRLADLDSWDDLIPMPDTGYLCQCAHERNRYYGFREISKQIVHKNTITIPSGTYFFRQDESSQIENAREIFKEQLEGRDSFMVVETEEVFLSKTRVSQAMYELRLIAF